MKKIPDMTQAASVLLVDLKWRFRKFTDPHDPDHCPVYLAATCLDPRYKVLLNPTQLNSAKKEILKQVCTDCMLCPHLQIPVRSNWSDWNYHHY